MNTNVVEQPHHELGSLRHLANSLGREGRYKDALVLLEHLEALQSGDVEILQQIVRMLGADGQTLKAIEKLAVLKAVATNTDVLIEDIRAQLPAAIKSFNDYIARGQVVEAEKYASALAAVAPGNIALLSSALSCNLALDRKHAAAKYAAALLKLDPAHALARAALGAQTPVEATTDVHPLLRLRNLYDAASVILCAPLDDGAAKKVRQLLEAAGELVVDVPPGSEWEGWVKHYRLAAQALDLPLVLSPTPTPVKESTVALATAVGRRLDWRQLQARAERLGAKAVFFAAADRSYVDLYARWYIRSILKFCDVSCLVVVHVIGGAKDLKAVAKGIGIKDKRLFFAGDRFAAERVTTKCYDAPPKGFIAKPVAHFQSVRFLKLGTLIQKLKLPVFVSDIDLLLQRGVADLLQRCADADVVLNENTANTNAGSRLTANLVLVNPTQNAKVFLRFLKTYLERALSGSEVSRWIDQFGLLMARHHLSFRGKGVRIDTFDTTSDINNVMYRSYQEHPFRFLSLYHGFDTSSLEANPMVLGSSSERVRHKKVAART
jgi:hypothetical protein